MLTMTEDLREPCRKIVAFLRAYGPSTAEQIKAGTGVQDPQFGRCITLLEDEKLEVEFIYRALPERKVIPIRG